MENTFNVLKAREAQEKYCKEKNYPHFAPASGYCWKCNRNIYEPVGWKNEYSNDKYRFPVRKIEVSIDSPEKELETGITVEKAGNELVTGCPHCNRSYCD